jgi:hypothetical protein
VLKTPLSIVVSGLTLTRRDACLANQAGASSARLDACCARFAPVLISRTDTARIPLTGLKKEAKQPKSSEFVEKDALTPLKKRGITAHTRLAHTSLRKALKHIHIIRLG